MNSWDINFKMKKHNASGTIHKLRKFGSILCELPIYLNLEMKKQKLKRLNFKFCQYSDVYVSSDKEKTNYYREIWVKDCHMGVLRVL